MPSILPRSFERILGALPDWQKFSRNAILADVCIVAVGFEERTCAILKEWASVPGRRGAILIKYRTNASDNENNLSVIHGMLKTAGVAFEDLDYEQRTISARVSKALGKINGRSGVLVDLSSMASFVMYPVLRAIVDALPDQSLTIGYSEALKYYPERAEWESFWKTLSERDIVGRAELFDSKYFQSTGAEQVYEAMSFVSKNPSELPGKLVIIPNFSFHRVFNMLEYAIDSLNVDRTDVQWIIGEPPNKSTNGWRAEAIYKLCNQPKRCSYCCTLNYKDVFANLQDIWEKNYTSRSMHIATLGSKAQHLGIFLFLLMHPDVSLLLSEPTSFVADRFSEGIGDLWQLNLGNVDELANSLNGWNRLDFVWD